MTKRPTLKDVAAWAGVATTTVARVINNSGYVSKETRRRVENAVEATGYRVNSIARTLKANRSYTIGHLLTSTIPNPFFLRVARGVEQYCEEHGYTALSYNMGQQPSAERKGIETFLSWSVDAIIFSTPTDAANVEYASGRGIPIVQVERPVTSACHQITVNNYKSVVEAMRHLAKLGHRRIAYIGVAPTSRFGHSYPSDYVERERIGGYRQVMAEIGASTEGLITLGEGYQIDMPTAQGHGYYAGLDLLNKSPRPTAVFASNDILAAGFLQAVYELKLRVPDDISVIGCDDTLAGYLSPLLSSVRLPARRLGIAAAQLVISEVENGRMDESVKLVLEAEFVNRNSIGPATPADTQ